MYAHFYEQSLLESHILVYVPDFLTKKRMPYSESLCTTHDGRDDSDSDSDSDSDKVYSTEKDTGTISGLHHIHEYTSNHKSLTHKWL